jgi:hypothetical protein
VQLTAVPEEPEQSEPASASAPIPAGTPPPPITVAVVFGSSESGIFTNTARVNSQDNAGDPQQRSSSDAFHALLVGAIEQDDSGRTSSSTPITIDELANDLGNLNAGTVTVTTPPGHGTVTVNPSTGHVTYAP